MTQFNIDNKPQSLINNEPRISMNIVASNIKTVNTIKAQLRAMQARDLRGMNGCSREELDDFMQATDVAIAAAGGLV